jgi:hypothetical protein
MLLLLRQAVVLMTPLRHSTSCCACGEIPTLEEWLRLQQHRQHHDDIVHDDDLDANTIMLRCCSDLSSSIVLSLMTSLD